jgi:hypothetical protein
MDADAAIFLRLLLFSPLLAFRRFQRHAADIIISRLIMLRFCLRRAVAIDDDVFIVSLSMPMMILFSMLLRFYASMILRATFY